MSQVDNAQRYFRKRYVLDPLRHPARYGGGRLFVASLRIPSLLKTNIDITRTQHLFNASNGRRIGGDVSDKGGNRSREGDAYQHHRSSARNINDFYTGA